MTIVLDRQRALLFPTLSPATCHEPRPDCSIGGSIRICLANGSSHPSNASRKGL
jgi:hypothetical protein